MQICAHDDMSQLSKFIIVMSNVNLFFE